MKTNFAVEILFRNQKKPTQFILKLIIKGQFLKFEKNCTNYNNYYP